MCAIHNEFYCFVSLWEIARFFYSLSTAFLKRSFVISEQLSFNDQIQIIYFVLSILFLYFCFRINCSLGIIYVNPSYELYSFRVSSKSDESPTVFKSPQTAVKMILNKKNMVTLYNTVSQARRWEVARRRRRSADRSLRKRSGTKTLPTPFVVCTATRADVCRRALSPRD